MFRAAGWSLALALCGAALGQAPSARPTFEVARVKQNKSSSAEIDFDGSPSGLVAVRNIPVSTLFEDAFHVRKDAIIGAPGWFETERFDIVAKAPPETSDETLMLMTQSLLIDQFKMTVHKEQRVQRAFVLVVAKGGPKMRKSARKDDPDCSGVHAEKGEPPGQHFACTNMKMSDFVDKLGTDIAKGYIDKTVVDQTGLTDAYDFRLSFTRFRNVDQGGVTVFGAVQKLGLKLEEKKVRMPVMVIDHVERFVPEPE